MADPSDGPRLRILQQVSAGELAAAVANLKSMTLHELEKFKRDLENTRGLAEVVYRDGTHRKWLESLRTVTHEEGT